MISSNLSGAKRTIWTVGSASVSARFRTAGRGSGLVPPKLTEPRHRRLIKPTAARVSYQQQTLSLDCSYSTTTMPYFPMNTGKTESDTQNDAAHGTTSIKRPVVPPASVQVKNRRKRYLDKHPEYFSSPDLELAGPLALSYFFALTDYLRV